MENVPVFVGLDYHSKSVQVCVTDGSGAVLVNRRCGNSVMEIGGAIGSGREVRRAAIESCCGAADLAEALITELGWPVSLAHPGYVARMKHNPDKTDFGDARMLAELACAGLIPPVWLAPQNVRELRLLARLRGDLVGAVRAVKTRILAVLRQQRISEPTGFGRWCKKWLAWLTNAECALSEQGRFAVGIYLDELAALRGRISKVESRLREATSDDAIVAMLLRVKGVGEVTAWTMRALIGRFDRFANGKQLARFCAVTPRNASSGERVADSGMVKAGDPQLKSVVIEAAQRLRRYEPRWRELSASMAARGKPASVITGAVANRWLRGLYHQMKELPMAA
jgi:transposase